MTTQDDSYSTIKDRINTNKVNDDKEMLNTLCSAIKEYPKYNKYSKLELELQVSKIDYYRINEDKNKNPDQYSRNVFYNSNDIRNVTKYILNAGYKKSSNSTFLRISSKDNHEQLKRSFRICIEEAGIPSFCENNYSIYTGDNKNIHYENKSREMKTYNFTNYENVRANLKKEKDITRLVNSALQSPGQSIREPANFISDGKWENINKTFRFISRVSFTDDSNIDKSCARIDISTIYQSSKKKWEGVDEKKDKPIYEVEIEALNKDGCSEENIKNSILFALKAVLCGIQDSCLPMKSEEMKTISRAYSDLSGKFVSASSSSNSSWYDGPQPVTLQQEDVSIVCSPQISLEGGEEGKKKNKKEKSRGKSNKDKADKGTDSKEYTGSYNITNKADGTRKLLFILNGSTFFVDKQKQIQKSEIDPKYTIDKEENDDNTILDGELVTLRNGEMQYQVFDIYAYRNKSCLDMIFSVREKLFKGVVATLTGSANISVICKEFRNVDSTGIGSILDLNQLYSNINNEEGFENDGMILTPTGEVSGHNNSDKVYKWKSVEQTTIDFKVKVIDTKTNVSQNGTEGLNTKQNICELLVSMKEKPIEKACETVYLKTPTEIRDVSDLSNSKNNPVRFQVYGDNGELIEPGIAYFEVDNNNVMLTKVDENGKYQKFMNGDIVECEYSKRDNNEGNWVPIRVRSDKTFPNAYDTAKSNYDFILKPVEISVDLCNDTNKDETVTSNTKDVYYTNVGSRVVTNRNNFHNYIKKGLLMDAINAIKNVYSNDLKLIDYGVGKGGDIFKWRDAKKIKFAYGIDYSASNLQDDVNGACARYIRMLKDKKNTNRNLECMFAQGDCSKSIENGDAFEPTEESGEVNRYTDESLTMANLINKSIFETIKKELIPPYFKGVINVFGKGGEREEDRFHIGSSQFAMHYFFKNKGTVQQFIDNLKYTIRVGGYFIGTCYNGTRVLELLQKQDHYRYKTKSNVKIELVMKSDESDENDEESDEREENVDSEEEVRRFKYIRDLYNKKIGGVSIRVEEKGFKGQEEYLVNFRLFDDLMKRNGFNKIENKSVEFSKVYYHDHDNSKMKSDCIMNDDEEKVISFLNDKFIYKNDGVDSSVPYESVPMPRKNSNKSKARKDKEEEEEEEEEEED